MCNGHSFAQSSKCKVKTSFISTYTPHFLFMALYQHVCEYMPINNPIVPIGILYCAKNGAFQKEFNGAANAPQMRRSVHMFWNVILSVYSSFMSPLYAEVMARMVYCGDFMLSSLRGVQFVTDSIKQNFCALQQHMQTDADISPRSVVLEGVLCTDSFTNSEITLLFRCLLHCCNVKVAHQGSVFDVLSIASVIDNSRPVMARASAITGLELNVMKTGTRKRAKMVLRNDMEVKFDVRSSFSQLEIAYLKLVSANACIESYGKYNVYRTTVALLRHFDNVDSACAVAALYGARLMQNSSVEEAIEPVVYSNKWLDLSHTLIEERIRTACCKYRDTQHSEDFVVLQAMHVTMFSKQSGFFVNALIHMDKKDALHCINAACQSGFACIVVRNIITGAMLSIDEVKLLLHNVAYDQKSRFDVLLRSENAFAITAAHSEMYEQIALNVTKQELTALCGVCTYNTHLFSKGQQHSLARLLLHAMGIDDCDMETTFVQAIDMILLTWITLLVHVNSNEGRPPKRAVTFR
jgi:hypothetical protein